MEQTRWLCDVCAREWLYAHDWTPEMGCPGCHASRIQAVRYRPAFRGGDIVRSTVLQVSPSMIEVVSTPPALPLLGGAL